MFTEPPRVYDGTPADAPLATRVVTATTVTTGSDVSASMGGLKALILKSMATPTVIVTGTTAVSGTAQVLSDAELAKIMPAAGPTGPMRKWWRSVWKYEWADLGK